MLDEIVRRSKERLLTMHFKRNVGHIGGNLSSIDLLVFLHHRLLGKNDLLVLSKGHSAGALYVALWSVGKLTDEDLLTFHADGTKLSGHPAPNWIPEIPFATGSLGHGLSLAAGMALGKKLKNESGHVYCLMSDGEWDEGSNWEALIFTAHHKLDNLTIIVDNNGLQGFGATKEISDLSPLTEKFAAFGLPTEEIDGHDLADMEHCFSVKKTGTRAVVARTIKGHGVSFMENKMEWHYLPMSESQYNQAIKEISGK